ncbi:MAG: hypothetical protein OEW12_04655 [Deltaproteobacteria bacterium]|nr:hypothetical protein [Deltaproteobacteria bacterium]
MARRILSADSLLAPQTQTSLDDSVRTEPQGMMQLIQSRWASPVPANPSELLFDWENREALLEEISFVNQASAFVDEAAVKIAPSVLRIVLTVKSNLPDPVEQRSFLAEKMDLDFRRISELCIVADSFQLLDKDRRLAGAREIERYGWSKSLKLSAIPDPREREDIWQRACDGRATASYRDVLEEIRRYRERKLLPASTQTPPEPDVASKLADALGAFNHLNRVASQLDSAQTCQEALKDLDRLQKDLAQVKKAIQNRMKTVTP